jgi:Tol biopolymer transport system component
MPRQPPGHATNCRHGGDVDLTVIFSGESERAAIGREDGVILAAGTVGESVRRLTTSGFQPAWFPDGRQIVFASGDGSSGPEDRNSLSELWIVSTSGGEARRLFAGDAVQPQVSPHGRRIAFWSVPADQKTGRLTNPDSTGGFPRATDWSPDGRRLAIAQNGGVSGVWVYSFDARAYRRVVDGNNPAWLSDGRRVIYENRGRLFIADTASGATREVLAIPGESLSEPRLTADDSQLFFRHGTTDGDIWLMRFDPK